MALNSIATGSNSLATDEGSSKLPKRLVFQRKSLVCDFRKRTLRNLSSFKEIVHAFRII